MLKPSVGYKMIPMLWYEMMGVNRIVGFILPDWIADVMPGKYPVHNQDGTVDPNLEDQNKEVFVNILRDTKLMIPSLTDERYLEDDTKNIINN